MSQGLSQLKLSMLFASLMMFFTVSAICADDRGDNSFTPSMLPSVEQENASSLNLRLQTVKKDLESYRSFAEYFSNSGEMKTSAQLHAPLEDYFNRHVENLLDKAADSSTLETVRLSAEIMIIKARIYMTLKNSDVVTETISSIKKQFAPFQKITVQISGKTTMLDEVIHQLEDELAKISVIKK